LRSEWRTVLPSGVDHQRVFFTDGDRRTYLEWLTTYAAEARARILAYCLMDNHIHLVAIPEETRSLATALRRAHGRYSLYLNTRRKRSGHLWQNRFYSCPLDDQHLWIALRYVERNPVRANLVARPEEYAWSSAAAHLGFTDPPELLDLPFHAQAGGTQRWAALLAEPEELIDIRALQRGTFSGRPLGSDEFVTALEQTLHRPLRSHQGERPRLSAANTMP
jgi:putative transposase